MQKLWSGLLGLLERYKNYFNKVNKKTICEICTAKFYKGGFLLKKEATRTILTGVVLILILAGCELGIMASEEGEQLTRNTSRNVSSIPFLKVEGTKIVTQDGDDFYMTGINLGNWLLWEGYLMMGDFNYRTHSQFFDSLKAAFGGDINKALEFEHQWRLNYVTEQAIIDLKNLGFNTLRVPFHFNMFWDWDSYSVRDHGFQYFDNLIEYCRDKGMYVLLDMHAAPGYQNPGDHSDNVDSNASQPRDTVKFWDGDNINIASEVWKHIADYYKDEPVVWGYDLINEPVPQPGREFELMESLITMTNAIREVDTNHIIVAEGSWWGSDMQKIDWMDPETQNLTGIDYRWDDNLVYQTHHYSTDISLLDQRLAITNKLNVPLILGEYGESDNGNLRNMTDWCIDNEVGYFPWSFKKMSHDRTLWTIPPNGAYQQLKDFINFGGEPPAGLYEQMISFAQNNIVNGAPDIIWHQGFYDAVKNITPEPQTLPGRIEAESYSQMSGIQKETTQDTSGDQNIGYVDQGDWVEYEVDIASSQTYRLDLRVAAEGTETKTVEVRQGSTVVATVSFSGSGGWQNWKTVSTTVPLEGGLDTLTLYFATSGLNLNWLEFSTDIDQDLQAPTSPTVISTVPGVNQILVEWEASRDNVGVEGYEVSLNGGSPVQLADTQYTFQGLEENTPYTVSLRAYDEAGNYSLASQVSAVTKISGQDLPLLVEAEDYTNMSGVQTESCALGGLNVGWTDPGDYLEYNINPNQAGSVQFEMEVAGNGGVVELFSNGTSLGVLTIPSTSGWQDWTTTKELISLPPGEQVLKVSVVQGGFNFNLFRILSSDDGSGDGNSDVVDDFELLLEGEAYHEMSGIALESCSEGGQNVGWIDSGDWFNFDITIPQSGTYTVEYRLASNSDNGHFRLDTDGGITMLDEVFVSSTGGWQNWTTITSSVYLDQGDMTIGLYAFTGGFNVNWIRISQ